MVNWFIDLPEITDSDLMCIILMNLIKFCFVVLGEKPTWEETFLDSTMCVHDADVEFVYDFSPFLSYLQLVNQYTRERERERF